ncbi:MAG: PilZ domain-containing protein [Desulfobaccales bacterium]
MERRNYPRTDGFIPIEFQIRHLETPDEPWIGRGVLTNLSFTGIFFVPDDQPPLKPGDIRDFIFTPAHFLEERKSFIIKARGKVMRIEMSDDHTCLGVAVNFLAGPYFG